MIILNLKIIFHLFIVVTVFLNLGINSVRVSSLIPLESRFMSLISLYFFLSMLYTFLAFIWFIMAEYLKTRKFFPIFVLKALGKNKIESTDSSNSNIEDNIRVIQMFNNAVLFLLFFVMLLSYLIIWCLISV